MNLVSPISGSSWPSALLFVIQVQGDSKLNSTNIYTFLPTKKLSFAGECRLDSRQVLVYCKLVHLHLHTLQSARFMSTIQSPLVAEVKIQPRGAGTSNELNAFQHVLHVSS